MNKTGNNPALKFLQQQSGLVLSTLSADNKLESAYVFYAVNDRQEIFILTHTSTEKYRNIHAHKEVAFVVTDEKNFMTLQGKGSITEVIKGPESMEAFNAIMKVIVKKVQNWPPPVGKFQDSEVVIYKITPSWTRLRDYANSKDFISDTQ